MTTIVIGLMLYLLVALLLGAAEEERALSGRPRIEAGQSLWIFFNHPPVVWAAP